MRMETNKAKQALRKEMALRKKTYTKTTLSDLSGQIISHLEQTPLFQAASCIALYHALPGEVQTARLLDRWHREKRLLLPLVDGNDLRMLRYEGPDSLEPGAFGILEPKADGIEAKPDEIDLIIVPGVAFDDQLHRLGRGRGFYDRLLAATHAPKIGICYGFQLVPLVPTEPFDIPMDYLLTEKGLIASSSPMR